MDPRAYIEAIARELSRIPGGGLVLSPADTRLALGWHAAGIALREVLAELHRIARPKPPLRGAARLRPSLAMIGGPIESRRARRTPSAGAPTPLSEDLLRASRADVAGRAAWQSLAARAEDLLARGADAYWSEAFLALKGALPSIPRDRLRELGKALRARMAPRPPTMTRDRYRKSLQIQLLCAASERLGVPPPAFLL